MKKVLTILFHPVTLIVVGLLALSLFVWFVGPLVMIGTWRPLDTPMARLIFIGLIVAGYAAIKVIAALRARTRNRSVVSELAAAPGAAALESPEVAQLRARFEQALAVLRNAPVGGGAADFWSRLSWRLGGRYLYQLPWYVIIGAPGSGKTTALLNSGLRFPLAERLGAGAVKGVGGTRNCDWWFAEQAVLLDTAGRYTTQEGDPEADRKAWTGFLALLKRARTRRPLNGTLVTVSTTDLLSFNAAQRAEYAATLRRRVDELQQQLGLRMPVYVLVTKSDLLAGFMDYFSDGDRLERSQAWGFTFDEKAAAAGAAAKSFASEFDLLTQRLLDGVVDQIQSERDRDRRARIYGFPQQFGGLRTALAEIVEALGASSSYGLAPLLRGVYFVSGTQEGTPLDRLLGTYAREFRLEAAILPPNRSTGRSFFISRVLTDVVFAEADLAGTNPGAERRRLLATWGAYAGIAVVSVLLLVGWTVSYINNRELISAFEGRIANLKTLVGTPNRASAELLPVVPMLDAAADLARPADHVPGSLGWGLYQGEKLQSAANVVYGRVLLDALLPRIALRIEQLMHSASDNLQLLYEALKAYMMLHSPENYDRKALQQFVAADWDANLAGQLTPEQRTALDGHLQHLFDLQAAASPLAQDRALVDSVRSQILAVPLPQRVYGRLKWLGVASDIPEFTIAHATGTQGQLVFKRRSDTPLSRGVSGLFTYDGYHRAFQKAVVSASEQLADEEPWVLGAGTPKNLLLDPAHGQRVADSVRDLYLHEYVAVWDAFISDIRLADASGIDQMLQQARSLSAPENPLVPLLRAISHETTLLGGEGQGLVERAEAKAATAIEGTRQQLGKIFGGTASAQQAAAQPERIVDDHFADLRALVTSPGGNAPAPINATIGLIGETYNYLNVAAAALTQKIPVPQDPVTTRLKAESARLPDPLRPMLGDLASSAQRVTHGQERENLARLVNAQIGQFCQQAIEGRYPFNRVAEKEVTQEDFARVFGPGGLFDDFVTKNLLTRVDPSTWTFRQGEGSLGADRGTLLEFQRAAAIRETFFRGGGQAPTLRLEFTPFDMDASITQFNLDVDGQQVQWSFGPKIPKTVVWPGPRGSGQVRLTLSPAVPGASGIVTSGPWALFRLFNRMQIEPSNVPERFRVVFIVEGRRAIFDVTASSVQNPFTMRELREFHCPLSL